MIGFEKNIGTEISIVGFNYTEAGVPPIQEDSITLSFLNKDNFNFDSNSPAAWNNRLNSMGSIGFNFTKLKWQGNVLKLFGNLLSPTKLNIVLDLNLLDFEISKLQNLTLLGITGNETPNVSVPSLPLLKILGFQSCGLTTLAISPGCVELDLLAITSCTDYTGTIDLSEFHLLKSINLYNSRLSEIVFPFPNIITYLDVQSNLFESLNLSGLDKLNSFLGGSNPLQEISLSNAVLRTISITGTPLEILYVGSVPQLKNLDASANQIIELKGYDDVSLFTNQTIFNLKDNYLPLINIIELFDEIINRAQYPQLIDVSGSTNADVSTDSSVMDLIDVIRSNGTIVNCNGYPA